MSVPWLIEVSAEDLLMLPPAARALWATLVRRRDRAGTEAEWFIADLRQLARYSGLAYSTATAALACLRRAGLVATSRCQVNRWFRDRRGVLTTGMANEHNLYLVIGSYTKRSGVETIKFPRRAWLEYTDHVRAMMRPSVRAVAIRAQIRVKAWWTPHEVVEWQPDWLSNMGPSRSAAYLRGFRKNPAGFRAKLSTSVYFSNNSASESHSSTKNEMAKCTLFSLGRRKRNDHPAEASPRPPAGSAAELELMKDLLAAPQRPLVPLPGEASWFPPDALPKPVQMVTWISPEALPELKARAVLEGFRSAVNKVYGTRWHGWLRGDIKKARAYKAFLRCGEAMADHSVPPLHWAIWRLTWFKANVPRFAKQPPPIHVAMSAKRVSERAGWFRKEYVLPASVHVLDPTRHEQRLRNYEASRRHQGFPEGGVWMVMPRWYYEKRQLEIADGIDDPHDCWPQRPKYADEMVTWWRTKADA